MIAVLDSLRALAGDALIAVGETIRPTDHGDLWPDEYALPTAPAVTRADVRVALDELDDSTLLNIAATIIASWSPLLLPTGANLTDAGLLVDALRDRADQFAALESDADCPPMGYAPPTCSPQPRGE